MNFRLHKIFAAVCDCQSVSRAAETLHMTQPAVSHAIKRLEADSGLVLFDRLSKRLFLTEQGKEYLAKTRSLLELCDEMKNGAGAIAARQRLRVGSCLTIACWWLPDILTRFEKRGGEASIQVAAAGAITRMLERNEIDLALYEGPDSGGTYISMPFSTYRVVAACATSHRFAKMKSVPLGIFLKEKLLLREPGSAIRDVFDSFLRLRQMTIDPLMTSVNSQALIQAVKSGLGVSLLPERLVQEEQKKGGITIARVAELHLENENRIMFHVDKRQTEAMRLFIECVGG